MSEKRGFAEVFRNFQAQYRQGIVWIQHIPEIPARFVDFPDHLNPDIRSMLERHGIRKLYTHQVAAYQAVRERRHVIIVTPTASGKTLCYTLPVLQGLYEDSSARALYLFPTKALAQDQKAILRAYVEDLAPDMDIQTYDGDTPEDARKAIREKSRVILSNPDMLHTGILPHHVKWSRLFENLKYVVVDELHAYRGVFGSHVAHVIRRLRRICQFYGSHPVFIAASATVANPEEHAQRLLGVEVQVLSETGAPQGERYFVLYNPPIVDASLGIRRSFIQEAYRIASFLIENGLQTIVFAPSRLYTEIILRYLKERWGNRLDQKDVIRGYRGGYLPGKRREIEQALRAGKVRGVVSTNALELGVDIGALDASVITTYPGTMASLWQQAGRAGRRDRPAIHVFVASSRPLDQYLVQHPDYFFGRVPESARIDPDNLFIYLDHLKCSAFELPFRSGETWGGTEVEEWLDMLVEDGFLHHVQGQYHWISDAYPADAISLRTVTSDNFVVVDRQQKPRVIAEVDFSSALTTIHPKAVYMCEGQAYYVEELDFEGRKAYVRPAEADYFTDAIRYTRVAVLDRFEEDEKPGWTTGYGEVKVQEQVVGFKKIKLITHENVGSGELSLPEYRMHTQAYWLAFERGYYESWAEDNVVRNTVLHGLAYILHQLAPLILMVDARDLATAVTEYEKEEDTPVGFAPRLYLYEVYPGGVGLAQGLFQRRGDLHSLALDSVTGCACTSGCPSCIGPQERYGREAKGIVLGVLTRLVGHGSVSVRLPQ